jgi:predicted permease
MIRTFQALRHVQPGFSRPEEVLTLRIAIPRTVKEPPAVIRTEQNLVEKIGGIAGVSAVGLTTVVPMVGRGSHDPVYAEDHVYAEHELPPIRLYKFVSPGLVPAMGNTLIAGREFTWSETYDKRPVVMVSENLARELWREPQAALGKRVREGPKSIWREVVGVIADERTEGVDRPPPATIYWPILMDQFEGDAVHVRRTLSYVIRSPRAGTLGLLTEVNRAVWSVDPNVPLAEVRTLREAYDKSLARTSFTLVMLAIAGGMALLLGIAGIYGVIAYSVSQRTREIGIRIALGAQHNEVTRLFVWHGAMLAAIGIVCGLTAALLLTRLMSAILFDVSPVDPLTYIAVSIGLAAAAVLASYIPALHATTIDPIKALRAD